LGFFDQAYCDHDYDVGRTKARKLIDKINQSQGSLAPIHYTNRPPIRPINHDLEGLKLQDVPRDLRKRFKDRLTSRAHAFMAEIGIPTAFLREGIDLAFVTPHDNSAHSEASWEGSSWLWDL
jgi:hypothetical protein